MVTMLEVEGDGNGNSKVQTTKTEIQELREMQVNIQKQL